MCSSLPMHLLQIVRIGCRLSARCSPELCVSIEEEAKLAKYPIRLFTILGNRRGHITEPYGTPLGVGTSSGRHNSGFTLTNLLAERKSSMWRLFDALPGTLALQRTRGDEPHRRVCWNLGNRDPPLHPRREVYDIIHGREKMHATWPPSPESFWAMRRSRFLWRHVAIESQMMRSRTLHEMNVKLIGRLLLATVLFWLIWWKGPP